VLTIHCALRSENYLGLARIRQQGLHRIAAGENAGELGQFLGGDCRRTALADRGGPRTLLEMVSDRIRNEPRA